MPDYGVTATGFARKGQAEILEGIVGRQRATLDPAIDTSEHEVIGNLNGSVAPALAELWEKLQDVYDALDPDKATGASLDAVAALTATRRGAATYSTVTATVNLEPGASIAIGEAIASVDGNAEARFANAAVMANDGEDAADFEVVFAATSTGPVVANADTLTVKETSPTGWNSITNALDAELGEDVQQDAPFRLSREAELAAQGGGTLVGIAADLRQLDGVISVSPLENDRHVTDENGLPPHSFEMLVLGGDDAEIAASIWGNKPAGIRPYGSTVVTVEDSEGEEHTVGFTRPTEVLIYVGLEVIDGDDYAGDEAVRAAIVAAFETPCEPGYLEIADAVYASRAVCAALEVEGVLDVRATVSLTPVAYPSGSASLEMGTREIGRFDTSRIQIGAFD
jgi:uncharacterized phage protein gp47/JayE